MDEAKIRTVVLARNALRREARLPPLDIEREVQHARDLATAEAASKRYDALRDAYADEYERIRNAIINEKRASGNVGFPNGSFGHWALNILVKKRFAEFLATLDADEISSVTSDFDCGC